ncbi:Transcriptional regulatory protein, C terminal [Arthrobacter sp. ok909]|uniref:winged helix-turn-helix domain-containing protein n=1 Tax=Arthrobacter sp. ok909 TaxID=1761746 RepID=UPI000889AB0D|nr:winged helix-turn-helix domain-containing protein [Arthrobacter sp. ok909]SDP47337.1 Transcriptional regulatory protein, C terminal [Arthrobacter sp. ok909]
MSQPAAAGPAHAAYGQRGPVGRTGHVGRVGRPGQIGRPGQAGLTAKGLAVWVTLPDNADCDPAALARAAELVLGRALRCAPEAEVHFRPAAGAATSAVVRSPGEDGTPAGIAPEVPAGAELLSARAGDDDGASVGGGAPVAPAPGNITRLAVDLAAGDARLDGERVPLTDVEFALLRCLVQNCSRTVTRQELQHCLDAFDTPGAATRSIDVYVGRVRRKLKGCRHAVVTVRSGGYRFVPGPLATVRGPAEYTI